jgi:Neuraminidase (sialidase)
VVDASPPSQVANNGRSIFSTIKTAYSYCDNSSYGWGVPLNEQLEARGFWSAADQHQHITRKEMKAVRVGSKSG